MKMLSALLLAAMVGTSMAVCPNACSGHGVCNKFDECECDAEGKTGYYGNLYDITKGYARIYNDGIRQIQSEVTAASKTLNVAGSGDLATSVATAPSDLLTTAQDKRYLSKDSFVGKQYTGADCSLMTCPKGTSWTSPLATDPLFYSATGGDGDINGASRFKLLSHSVCKHMDFVECSDGGMCDRSSGQCKCFPQYEGVACERTVCPGDCSGHGVCKSNIELSVEASLKRSFTGNAHLTQDSFITMKEDPQQADPRKTYMGAWDSGANFGCKCDGGYRGEDCSLKECPSTNDPLNWNGNTQGEDCSGRGICDYSSGECKCFPGFKGQDCGTVESLI